MPTTPRDAASAAMSATSASATSGSTSLSRREISKAGASRSMPTPSGAWPSRRRAAVFIQTLCTSALIRYVGTSPVASSSTARLGTRPQRVAEARADPAPVRQHGGGAHDPRGVGGGFRVPERLALRGEGPLHDMHVVVPQPRNQPGAVGLEHLAACRKRPRRARYRRWRRRPGRRRTAPRWAAAPGRRRRCARCGSCRCVLRGPRASRPVHVVAGAAHLGGEVRRSHRARHR